MSTLRMPALVAFVVLFCWTMIARLLSTSLMTLSVMVTVVVLLGLFPPRPWNTLIADELAISWMSLPLISTVSGFAVLALSFWIRTPMPTSEPEPTTPWVPMLLLTNDPVTWPVELADRNRLSACDRLPLATTFWTSTSRLAPFATEAEIATLLLTKVPPSTAAVIEPPEPL